LASGDHAIVSQPHHDKDTAVKLVKGAFKANDVVRYCFIAEAWMVDTRGSRIDVDMEHIKREGVSRHPDRREIVAFSAENKEGQMLTGRCYILRPEHGPAKLSPLVVDDMTGVQSKGRMVGLLQ
jgi:hypothetical protein